MRSDWSTSPWVFLITRGFGLESCFLTLPTTTALTCHPMSITKSVWTSIMWKEQTRLKTGKWLCWPDGFYLFSLFLFCLFDPHDFHLVLQILGPWSQGRPLWGPAVCLGWVFLPAGCNWARNYQSCHRHQAEDRNLHSADALPLLRWWYVSECCG